MLTKEQIITLLQLNGVGRKAAFKLCNWIKDNAVVNDSDFKLTLLEAWKNTSNKKPEFDFENAFYKTDKIIKDSEKQGIGIISYFDDNYPVALKDTQDPPIILNYKGNIEALNNKVGIAIIGTRKPTSEGLKAGEFFSGVLAEQGFNIVSGLAEGCDASGHKGCLDKKGFTTAILAHGLHTIYPKSNKELAKRILDNSGVLLSEYFIGVSAFKNYFVERDRLQAGLSNATIVIQTGISGGTMHAVKATLESKKILAAVKYKSRETIDIEKIAGNEMLIKDKGAFPLTNDSMQLFLRLIKNIANNELIEIKKSDDFYKNAHQGTFNFDI